MSYFCMNFADAYAEHRNKVKRARQTLEKRKEALSRYADSEQAKTDLEEAQRAFESELEAARQVAKPKFDAALTGMRSKCEPEKLTPPTSEQLLLLQVLDMRDDLSSSEIEAACNTLADNDPAVRALRDICARKGKVLPPSFQPVTVKRRAAVAELEHTAAAELEWDGRSREQILSDAAEVRHQYKWGSGQAPTGRERISAPVADIEAASYYVDTIKRLVPDYADVIADLN